MKLTDYVAKMCELGLVDNELRVIKDGDIIYKDTMGAVMDDEKYPWNGDMVLGISSFSYMENGKIKYNTMISI